MNDTPSLFDLTLPKYRINKPIRLIELFAGIGSQAKALKNLNANFEHYRVCEFDKYAIDSYNAVHNTNFETSDITKIDSEWLGIVDTDKFEYIMTYSFCCQDLSLAGKRAGMEKGSGTRSGLLWEVERLLTECVNRGGKKALPQILLMENVKQVITAKGWHDWCAFLEKLGYSNYCQILNGADYEIPQHRERAFMVSILGEYSYSFPNKKLLKTRLINKEEENVDEKYFLTNQKIKSILSWKAYQKPFEKVLGNNSICPTLTARGAGEEHSGMILISPDLDDTTNIQNELEILVGESVNDIGIVVSDKKGNKKYLRIRKPTSKECWRLMGFDDEDFEKAEKVNSNAQLYKQAGNSIIVNVLMAIFKELL